MKSTTIKIKFLLPVCLLTVLGMTGCNMPGYAAKPTIDATAFFQSALLTATYGVPSATPKPPIALPTSTPLPPTPAAVSPTPAAPRTPPALPDVYHSTFLNSLDTPHTYVKDACQYLKNKWDPNNSAPGTILMPIMFHGISDAAVPKANEISHNQLTGLLKNLKDQGFEAISMQQAADFMTKNAKIPSRSVLLIVDDRHYKQYFEINFGSQLRDYKWPLINAWINLPDSITTQALPDNIDMQNSGMVDHQAHGVVHNIPISEWPSGTVLNTSTSSIPAWGDILKTVALFPAGTFFDASQLSGSGITAEGFVHMELYGAKALIQKNFGKAPIAYIWPGGGFSAYAVKIADEAGYQLGFTINPRGPVMYNWVPLADNQDPARPSYLPEGKVENPLMVLPRYWDTDASNNIDNVRQIGKQAAALADQNKTTEMLYYDIMCSPTLGPIPTQAAQ